MRSYVSVDLNQYCCACGATYNDDRSSGCVNAWGNSFPGEELPFGGDLEIAGIPFRIPRKQKTSDHIECLGQRVSLSAPAKPSGVALLCFGEMGDQDLTIEFLEDGTVARKIEARAKEWLIEGSPPSDGQCYMCSHLHYRGGYELALLRPVCWVDIHTWDSPTPMTTMRLGFNPLFHLFAATLLYG